MNKYEIEKKLNDYLTARRVDFGHDVDGRTVRSTFFDTSTLIARFNDGTYAVVSSDYYESGLSTSEPIDLQTAKDAGLFDDEHLVLLAEMRGLVKAARLHKEGLEQERNLKKALAAKGKDWVMENMGWENLKGQ